MIKTMRVITYVIAVLAAMQGGFACAKDANSVSKSKEVRGNHSSLQSVLHSIFPRETINVSYLRNAVVLSGSVSSVEVADRVERLVKEHSANGIKILNFMKLKGSQQVMLRVRVGEVKREVLRDAHGTEHMPSFDVLAQRGLLKTLAEPNLVAMSGEKAEFLSGGEFPVPTVQKEGNISIDYKSYGIKLSFTPLVLSPNRIRLNVEQELSELAHDGAVMTAGFKIPSVSSRKAKTTIELAPGESFMIAGLVKENSDGKRAKETETVISITPYLVNPMHSKDLKLPAEQLHGRSKLEKSFIDSAITSKGSNSGAEQPVVAGPVGFIAE